MSSTFPELVFTDTEDFDATRLNKAMEVIDQRLRVLEPFSPQWEVAVNELRLFGLARINETIAPAYERVQRLAQFGFLVADSATSLTLSGGHDFTFVIGAGPKRDLFTPTPFLAITREANATDYAVGRFKSYDARTGNLVVTILTVTGNAGPFSDWWIGPLAGNTLAAMQLLTETQSARNGAVSAMDASSANAAQTSLDRISTTNDAAAAHADRLAADAAAASAATFDQSNFVRKDSAAGSFDPANYIRKDAAGTYAQTITFSASPVIPTVTATDSSTKGASTAFVAKAVADLVTAGDNRWLAKFPAGTAMLFVQSAAPVGWTKSTAHNDKALRIVSGAASSGGALPFSTAFARTTTDYFTLSTNEMPWHGHNLQMYFRSYNVTYNGGAPETGEGTMGPSAPVDGAGASWGHTHGMDMRVQYVDSIIATKD
ncbi:MAG: hypothetical protein JWP25_7560 [Bradyrhizobium sp.]|nr:hypothetical protein [Bradyrhizobium sp.]